MYFASFCIDSHLLFIKVNTFLTKLYSKIKYNSISKIIKKEELKNSSFLKQIYKPGSVVDSHLSRIYIAIYLKPRKSRKWRAALTFSTRCCSRQGLHSRYITIPLVGFYSTFSPEPLSGCYFLLHFPYGYPRLTLSSTIALWSPDFPLAYPFEYRQRLFNLLYTLFYSLKSFQSRLF